jgi:hypothetical protein
MVTRINANLQRHRYFAKKLKQTMKLKLFICFLSVPLLLHKVKVLFLEYSTDDSNNERYLCKCFVLRTSFNTTTDIDGNIPLNVPAGDYVIQF